MKKLITVLLMTISTSGFAATDAQCNKANNNFISFGMLHKSIYDNALGSRDEKLNTTSVTLDEYKKWTENKFNYDIKTLMIDASKETDFSYPLTLSYAYLPRLVAMHAYIYNYLETKDASNIDKLKTLNSEIATIYKTLKKECPKLK